MKEYSLEVVVAYMGHIQACAETAVREMLRFEFDLFIYSILQKPLFLFI